MFLECEKDCKQQKTDAFEAAKGNIFQSLSSSSDFFFKVIFKGLFSEFFFLAGCWLVFCLSNGYLFLCLVSWSTSIWTSEFQ